MSPIIVSAPERGGQLTSMALFRHMNRLTRQEQMVLCVVLGLLLVGWAVKVWRTAHPTKTVEERVQH